MTTLRDPDQLEAAMDELFRLLCVGAENPGAVTLDNLGGWLRLAAAERERQGDFGAAQMLDALAGQAEDNG